MSLSCAGAVTADRMIIAKANKLRENTCLSLWFWNAR